MSTLPSFPFTEVKTVRRWSNFHGTVDEIPVPVYAIPDVASLLETTSLPPLRRSGDALRAVVGHCLESNPPRALAAIGGRWSLSNVLVPRDVAVDTANVDHIARISEDHLLPEYRAHRPASSFTPLLIQGGATLSSINRRLGHVRLALPTTPASNGQRIAGCIATGTHGAAVHFGAVHDAVLGIHLIVGRDRSFFIQPESAAMSRDFADLLEDRTGIPTEAKFDDALFGAALVPLGSLGLVHAVVMEAVSLYKLRRQVIASRWPDEALSLALATQDPAPLAPDVSEPPHHFEVVFSPYASRDDPRAFVTLMWKEAVADDEPVTSPGPAFPSISTDVMEILGGLGDLLGAGLAGHILENEITKEIARRYRPGSSPGRFPGEVFGPSSLPPGGGASTEIVVSSEHLTATLDTIQGTLTREAARGKHLLGAMSLRFVGGPTPALLGMNIHETNCYLELPSIRNNDVLELYRTLWEELKHANIPFTCHWGQLHGMTPSHLADYFGDRVDRWKEARRTLLDSPNARTIFASPLLAETGLDGEPAASE